MAQATIIFANDARIVNHPQVEQFVKDSSGSFSTLIHEDEFIIVIKEMEIEKQTYDQVRMIAGAVAR
ncbi:MAG TPA: hypothetical protein VK135_08155, partial [Candidatus Dormibacteraeota bacterium]|nr:hypothetical protein [Candidatus Dormibacteraeota bacterium]